jgi:hypothetical protein
MGDGGGNSSGNPTILLPVAFVWYLNLGGIYAAVREARKRRAARRDAGLAARRAK